LADNLIEQPKAKENGEAAALKVELAGKEQGEPRQEPLSLLSISGIDARKAIAESRKPSAEEIATASPVSKLRADQPRKAEMISVSKEGESLKSIYEDGIFKLYDEPGKSHFGFKFLEPGGANKERLSASAAPKNKVEDILGTISLQYRVKF
jgi:hypothetical protein